MQLFAHNGVSHATTAETVGHSAGEVALITLGLLILAVGLMAAATYGLHKLGWVSLPTKEKDK